MKVIARIDPPSPSKLPEKLSKVLKGKVSAALLFGGKAKGYSLKSDYDIAVYFGRPHTLYELGELVVDMAKALEVQEDQLDVVSLDSATPEMILEALNGKPIYVEDYSKLFELKLKAITEWLDIKNGIQACSGVKAE